MVYRGPPSKACPRCRARRIKCDYVQPSCSQCTRKGEACGGYRNLLDLKFRDESNEIAFKVQTTRNKGSNKIPPRVESPALSPGCSDVGEDPDLVAPLHAPLCLSAEDQAIGFFFNAYVAESDKRGRSIFKYLPELYNNDACPQSALSSIITAIGLAGLSGYIRDPDLMSAANLKYNSSLKAINRDLYDPTLARADQTLVTVLLMGIYETSTCRNIESMRAWLKHINGATALLELRGQQQLATDLGFRLFSQVRTQIYAFCIQTRVPVPPYVVNLCEQSFSYSNDEADTATSKLSVIVASFCNLRARLGMPKPSRESLKILSELLHIDDRLTHWCATLPASFHYSTFTDSIPGLGLTNIHHYPDLRTASLYNNHRVIRILVHVAIRNILVPTPEVEQYPNLSDDNNPQPLSLTQIPRQLQTSQASVLADINSICASIPYHLDPSLSPYPKLSSPTEEARSLPPCAAAMTIMMPLFVAADNSFCPDPVRVWIIQQLRIIGEELGVRQATTMAGILTRRLEVTELLIEEAVEG